MHTPRRAQIVAGLASVAALGAAQAPARPAFADNGPMAADATVSAVQTATIGMPRDLDLRDALTARYPTFGGSYVDEKTQVAVLLFQDGQAPDAKELASVAAGYGYGPGSYVVGSSTWNRAGQLDLQARIIRSYSDGTVPGTGAHIVSIDVRDRTGQVEVGVSASPAPGATSPTASAGVAAAQSATQVMSADAAVAKGISDGRVVIGSTDDRPAGGEWTDRWSDVAPYNGGDLIYNPDQAVCTSGWPVTVAGSRALLGAGHCGENKYFVGHPGTSSNYIGESNGTTIAGGSSSATATVDTMLIEGGSVNDKTWRLYNTRVKPNGTPAPGEGRYVCFGGAITELQLEAAGGTEQEKCGTIDVVDRIDYYSGDGWRKSLSCIWGGRFIGTTGDSGGPVYWDTAYGLSAAGTITGNDTGYIPSGEGPDGSCFTQMAAIVSATGSTVITG